MFETMAFKGSWNQEEQAQEGVCGGGRLRGGGGVENRKPKGWKELGGCMMKHRSVLAVVSSTHKKQKAFSFSNCKNENSKHVKCDDFS